MEEEVLEFDEYCLKQMKRRGVSYLKEFKKIVEQWRLDPEEQVLILALF